MMFARPAFSMETNVFHPQHEDIHTAWREEPSATDYNHSHHLLQPPPPRCPPNPKLPRPRVPLSPAPELVQSPPPKPLELRLLAPPPLPGEKEQSIIPTS